MDVEELLKRGDSKSNTDSDWLKLEEDIKIYLSETSREKQDSRIAPLGLAESVLMICDGIRRKKIRKMDNKENG